MHGGGFYQVRNYLVAPERLPHDLIWHKWQAYVTWITGFALLVWIYYLGADLFLVNPSVQALSPYAAAAIGIGSLAVGWLVYDGLVRSPLANNEIALAGVGFAFIVLMAWFYQHMFSGRGALIHTGALMGTMMVGNVFFNIMPNQRKVIADLVAGREPNPAYRQAGENALDAQQLSDAAGPVPDAVDAFSAGLHILLRFRHRRAGPGRRRADPSLLQRPARRASATRGGPGACPRSASPRRS